jgi:hypothetical protein
LFIFLILFYRFNYPVKSSSTISSFLFSIFVLPISLLYPFSPILFFNFLLQLCFLLLFIHQSSTLLMKIN